MQFPYMPYGTGRRRRRGRGGGEGGTEGAGAESLHGPRGARQHDLEGRDAVALGRRAGRLAADCAGDLENMINTRQRNQQQTNDNINTHQQTKQTDVISCKTIRRTKPKHTTNKQYRHKQ